MCLHRAPSGAVSGDSCYHKRVEPHGQLVGLSVCELPFTARVCPFEFHTDENVSCCYCLKLTGVAQTQTDAAASKRAASSQRR